MNSILSILLVSVFSVLLSITTPCLSNPAMGGVGDVGRPSRPDVFESPEELRTYLDQLKGYFAVAGRPRFGKRLAPSENYRPMNANKNMNDMTAMSFNEIANKFGVPVDMSSRSRHPISSSDLYDLLYQYDE